MQHRTLFSNPTIKSFIIIAAIIFSCGALYSGSWYVAPSYPDTGDMQSMTIFIYPNGTQAIEGYWKGNIGRSRIIPVYYGGPIQWWNAGSWSAPLSLSNLPGSGSVQSQTDFVTPDNTWLIQGIWRGDQGWSRNVPVVNGVIMWSSAGSWSGPITLSSLPGSGSVQAQNEFFLPNSNKLFQRFWRNNQCYWRVVPRSGSQVDWSNASAWYGPIPGSSVPGSGNVQATAAYRLSNNKDIEEHIWINNWGYKRTLRMKEKDSFTLNPGGYSYLDWIFSNTNWIVVGGSSYHIGDDAYADDWVASSGSTEGQAAYAMAPGVVVYAGPSPSGWSYGNQVMVQCLDDPTFVYRYAHLQRVDVSVGEIVGLDTVLGLVGGTPSFSPHLHCVLYKNIQPNSQAMTYITQGKSPSGSINGASGPSTYAAMFYNQ